MEHKQSLRLCLILKVARKVFVLFLTLSKRLTIADNSIETRSENLVYMHKDKRAKNFKGYQYFIPSSPKQLGSFTNFLELPILKLF